MQTCSSTKFIGFIYLPSSEVTLVKSALFNILFCVLDIRCLDIDSETPAEDGFSWEVCAEQPVMETRNGKQSVKFSTMPALVYILATDGFTTDHEFLTDFLRTYRYFANGVDVSRILIMIYIRAREIAELKIQSGKEEDMKLSEDDMATHIKLRILNLFKKWIADQPRDFEEDQLLSGILTTFLSAHVSFDAKRAPYAQRMMEDLSAITPLNTKTSSGTALILKP